LSGIPEERWSVATGANDRDAIGDEAAQSGPTAVDSSHFHRGGCFKAFDGERDVEIVRQGVAW